MIEHTLLGRVIRAGFLIAGLLMVLGLPAATVLALLAGESAALDWVTAACRLGVVLAGAGTVAVIGVMCVPERYLRA